MYDGDGQRVIKCSGSYPTCSSGTLYLRGNAPDALAELTFAGAASQEYTFFNGKRVARRAGTGNFVYYYFADHLGSTGEITLASGVIDKTTVYYPYGGEISVNGPNFANNYKFTGKERDSESGLDNFGARFDASTLGRFMTPDWAAKPTTVPYANFGNPQSLNLYSYVENNPTTVGDPDGHALTCSDYPGLCSSIRDAVSSGKSIEDGAVSYLSTQATINTNVTKPPGLPAGVAQIKYTNGAPPLSGKVGRELEKEIGAPGILKVEVGFTTNGKHLPNSNHYRGTAADIDSINGSAATQKEYDKHSLAYQDINNMVDYAKDHGAHEVFAPGAQIYKDGAPYEASTPEKQQELIHLHTTHVHIAVGDPDE